MEQEGRYAVELIGINKTFPGGIQANKDITLRIREGEVHGLLGENGAGKSTIMNILYGFLSKDSGRIIIRGEEVDPKSPEDAIDRGVGMVHQHFKLIPPLTVTENVILGLEPISKKSDQSNSIALVSTSLMLLFLSYFFLSQIDFLIVAAIYLLILAIILKPRPVTLLAIGNAWLFVMVINYTGFALGEFLLALVSFELVLIIFYFLYNQFGDSPILIRLGNMLGGIGGDGFPIGIDEAAKKIQRIADENGLAVDPYAKIQDLSVGLQQRVEVIKTLYREADILILDEPTSVLTPQEVDELFVTLEAFRKSGKTIILITHKLREPMILCDRISVLRDGALVGTVNKDETSAEELAQMMVGRAVVFTVEKPPATLGEIVLNADNLKVEDHRGLLKVKGVSFQVRAGEILGIAGVEGNGQTELVEALAGLRKPVGGAISVGNINIMEKKPKGYSTKVDHIIDFLVFVFSFGFNVVFYAGFNALDAVSWVLSLITLACGLALVLWYETLQHANIPRFVREARVSHIPEDRHRRGLILPFTVEENLILGRHYKPPFISRSGILALDTFERVSSELVENYSIKTTGVDSLASTLSGGNQQKLVVSREMESNPILLIAAQPTRGLDVGATEFIHKTLISMRDKGVAILLVSAELDEIRSVADRILVMFDGRIVGEKIPDETDAQELGLLMAGHVDGAEQMEVIN
jgi:simple sugar transport system ATP-binding protein